MIQKQKRRNGKEKSNINRKWALSTYEGNVGLIRNYIEPMVGSVKLSEINTRFMEKYYQGLLQTKAARNPVKGE